MSNKDIEIVCRIAKCTKEEAQKALEESKGDIAHAVLILNTR